MKLSTDRTMRSIRAVLVGIFLLPALLSAGQIRNSNWVIGSRSWLHFTADTLESLPMSIADTISQRNACISDTSGQFLLLADDFGIRNALFDPIAGGSPSELGWNVPGGNYLILPVPGHPSRYAVFINELAPSARAGMVLVDVAADDGNGAVLEGTTWYMSTTTAKLTATTDASETGYWVVQHEENGDGFHAYHLTVAGLDPTPVISHAGTDYLPDTGPLDNMDRMGKMNFNFQGDVLATITNGPSIDTTDVELFHFDRTSGHVQYWTAIRPEVFYNRYPETDEAPFLGPNIRCLDFDRTGFLYLNHFSREDNFSSGVQQYDLDQDPDSLMEHARLIGGEAPWADTSLMDTPFGALLATAPWPYNRMIFRLPRNLSEPAPVPNQSIQLVMLPDTHDTTEYVSAIWMNFIPTWPFDGLPYPCKRYADDLPLGVITVAEPAFSIVDVRPNPMVDRAALVFNGPAHPETVVWRDALGREVRRAAVGQIGPTYTLEREGLPAGLYMVEVLGSKGTLGVVKVLCE